MSIMAESRHDVCVTAATSAVAAPLPPASRALAVASPSLDRSIETVVCIPCFRRPQHLRLTLESLAGQRTNRDFAVVIVENDAAACGSVPVAAEFLASDKIRGLCMVEPRQGNCHAINAAFETALATFPAATSFLMIDDDEIASEGWLERMLRAAETSGADARAAANARIEGRTNLPVMWTFPLGLPRCRSGARFPYHHAGART